MAEAADSLDDIRAYTQQRGPSCTTGIMLAAMDPALRETVTLALADPTIEKKALLLWLKERKDISLKYNSLIRHVRKECQCE